MPAPLLPRTRRGLRSVWVAILLILTTTLLPMAVDNPPKGLKIAVFLASIAAEALLCAGLALMTASPRESRVPRAGIAILVASVLGWGWPVVVYAADLPRVAFSGLVEVFCNATPYLQPLLVTVVLARLCRWMASWESAGTTANPGPAGWPKLARSARRLAIAPWVLLVATIAMEFAAFLLIDLIGPLALILPMVTMFLLPFAVLVWVIALGLLPLRIEWAFRRSAEHADEGPGDAPPAPSEQLTYASIGLACLAFTAFAAYAYSSNQELDTAWEARHPAESATRRRGGKEIEIEFESEPAIGMEAESGSPIEGEPPAGGAIREGTPEVAPSRP